jgi:hypothetical protein
MFEYRPLSSTNGNLKGAFIPIGGLTSGFPHQGSLGRGGPWGSVWPDNVEKTGVSPGGQSGSPTVTAEAEQVERTRGRTWSRVRSRFLCPTGRGTDAGDGSDTSPNVAIPETLRPLAAARADARGDRGAE